MWYKKLHNQIFIGIVLGVLLGIIIPGVMLEISFIGSLFILALKMVIAPLILSSVFTGITGLGDISKIGGIGRNTILYYVSTTFMAVLIGIIVVNIIRPGLETGKSAELPAEDINRAKVALIESGYSINSFVFGGNKKGIAVADSFVKDGTWLEIDKDEAKANALEEGFKAAGLSAKRVSDFKKKSIDYVKTTKVIAKMYSKGLVVSESDVKRAISTSSKKIGIKDAIVTLIKKALVNPFKAMVDGNTIGIIFIALLLGAFATMVPMGQHVISFMHGFNEVMFKIVELVIKTAPVGLLSLTGALVGTHAGDSESLFSLFASVGDYMIAVILGLAVHSFIFLPLILIFLGKMRPLNFFSGMRAPLLTAFSTASSSATLPLTFKATQDNLGVSKRTTDFVLPLGATINMDGTALYESVAVIFIANFLAVDLTFLDQFIIFITASIAAVGAAGIPSAGLVTMTIVLSAVGLPDAAIVIILAVDRFLDMFRTTINVQGDATGSVIIDRFHKGEYNDKGE